MMTEEEKLKQLERLQRVPPQEWRKVREALVRRMTERLNAKVAYDDRGVPYLVGGKTQNGAHSEMVLNGNALDVYMQRTFDALYFNWKWPEGRDIVEQAVVVLDSVISKSVDKYKRHPVLPPAPIDVDTLTEDEQPLFGEDDDDDGWVDKAREELKDEPDLLALMDAIDQLDDPKPKDVCRLLGIDGRQYDNLRKKLNRRLTKIIQK